MPRRSFHHPTAAAYVAAILFALVISGGDVVATPASASAQSATGTIEGTIVDQCGALMPGVTVTVVQPATGMTRTAVTDENGVFRLRCCRSASTT